MIHEFKVSTSKKQELIDITKEVSKAISKVKEGNVLVYVPHATAAIVINENDDPNVCTDLLKAMDGIAPQGKWLHDEVDNNGAAHIKAAILGPSKSIPIKDGKLMLGAWQSVMLVELDGPRDRSIIVSL